MKKISVTLFILLAMATAHSQTVNLNVIVNNVPSNKGVVKVCVFK